MLVLIETALILERPLRTPTDALMEAAARGGLELERSQLESYRPPFPPYFILDSPPEEGSAATEAGLRPFFTELFQAAIAALVAAEAAPVLAEEAYLSWQAGGAWGIQRGWLPFARRAQGSGVELGGLSTWSSALDDAFLELPLTAYLDFVLIASRGQPSREALQLVLDRRQHHPQRAAGLLRPGSGWRSSLDRAGLAVLEVEGPPPSLQAVLEAVRSVPEPPADGSPPD